MSAVALAAGAVGIDVEDDGPPDYRALAPVVIHDTELAAFARLAADEAKAAFRRLWTRKEAVLKAAGMGFSRDPRSFAVGLDADAAALDLDGIPYALADLPAGIGAVALRGRRIVLRIVPAPGT